MSQEASSGGVTPEITDQQMESYFTSRGEKLDVNLDNAGTNEGQSENTEVTESNENVTKNDQETNKDNIQEKEETKIEKVVPLAALHEERERRKDLAKRLEENESKTKRMEEAFQKLIQNNQPKEEIPSYEDDPLQNLRAEQQKIESKLKQTDEYINRQQLERQHQEAYNQFAVKCTESTSAFLNEKPDYKEAYDYLRLNRYNELQALGFNSQQALEAINIDEENIALKAYQDNVNPAERIYKLAEYRGYKNSPKESDNKNNQNKQKLEQIEKGQVLAKSLNGVGGGATESTMSLAKLAELEGPDFDKQWQIMKKQGKLG